MIEVLPIEKVTPSPDNPRGGVGDIKELAQSIEAVGIVEPLVVVPRNGGYEVVAGERRLAAAKVAGHATVPAIVRNLDDKDRLEIMLIENLQREDLTPLEEARSYARLIEVGGYTQVQLAERVGRSQPHVSKRLALLELPEKAQAALDAGGITVGDALELHKLKDMPKRLAAAMGRGRGGNIEWAVRQELADHEAKEKAGRAIQRLKKQGVKMLPESEVRRYDAKAPKRIGPHAYEHRFASVNVQKHAKEPCHAAFVDPRDGDVEFFCTNPSRHSKKGGDSAVKTGLTDQEKAKRRRKVEHNRARKEAAGVREEFAKALIGRRVKVDIGLAFLLNAWLHQRYGAPDGIKRAAELLGLPEPDRRISRGIDLTDSPRVAQVQAYAEESPGNAARAALALAIGFHEHAQLEIDYPRFDGVGRYFDLLRALGYEASPAEKLELVGKAPR